MKTRLFARFFESNSNDSARHSRRLSLETLENREMLNADWGGFASESLSTYTPEASAAYSVELGASVDACELSDLDGDGSSELVTFNYGARTVSVYSAEGTSGAYKLVGTQTLDSLSGSKGYDSAILSGDALTILSASSGVGLTATAYQWNASSQSFAQKSQTELDVSKFNSANADLLLFVDVAAERLGDSLVVQATTLTATGSDTKTVVYSGYGTSSFGSTSRVVSSITEELMGTTTINGVDYLLLKDSSSTQSDLVLASIGSVVSKYSFDLSGYGSGTTFSWVAGQDDFLVLGATTGSQSGLVTISASELEATVDATTVGKWVACDSMKLNASSAAAFGDFGGDSNPELFIVNGSSYAFYVATDSAENGYDLTKDALVVSSPEYIGAYLGDSNGDGATDAILVGESRLYVGAVSASGAVDSIDCRYTFTQKVKKAVFGDFNGDGLVDVAVLYSSTVGSSAQIFAQLEDGSFVGLAKQSFVNPIADIAVGRFSQTAKDELALMTTKSGITTVNALLYTGSGLTATRSFTSTTAVGTALTSGKLYGGVFDDLVVTNTAAASITVLKNGGSSFTGTTISTKYATTVGAVPTSAAIGDFNGDGKADIAVGSADATASVVYFLGTSSGSFGTKPSGRTLLSNAQTLGTLSVGDLNGDGYADLGVVVGTNAGSASVISLLGGGTSATLSVAQTQALSLDANKAFFTCFAAADSGNNSLDFVWAQDKTLGVALNGSSLSASGSVDFVLQSLSSASGSTYATAVSTERTWLDEWSCFYVDVWARAEGSAGVTSASLTFNYNATYFTLSEIESATGYTIRYSAEGGAATITATGSGAADSDGWVLLGRMKFMPGEGVALPSDGVLRALNAGFSATASAQTINGSTVASASAPTSISYYPYVFDADDNGMVNSNDMGLVISLLGSRVDEIDQAKYRVFDVDLNDMVNANDLANVLPALGATKGDGRDSLYQTEPQTRSTARLDTDEAFATLEFAVLDELDDAAETAIATNYADFYGPLPLAETLKTKLVVEL